MKTHRLAGAVLDVTTTAAHAATFKPTYKGVSLVMTGGWAIHYAGI